TTNASNHLMSVHRVVSAGMAHSRKRKADRADLTEADRVQLELLCPERYHKLMYTIASLAMAWPFQWTEHPLMRRLLSAVPDWPTLHPRILRHHIVEVYKATVVSTQASLLDVQNSLRGLNPFHLNLDLWTSKVSKQKFLGACVFYVNQDFTPESRLLGVKLFDPPHDLVRFRNGRRRLSDLLLLWLKMMLGEYRIQLSDFRSSTSDSGSDVKRLLSKLMPDSSWDWCIPHLINRAFTDAFGASVDVQASKNVECRELITKLKKQIQYFHQREGAATLLKDLQESLDDSTSALRLLSDVPQRWSSIAKLLKRALELWGLMETASRQRNEIFIIKDDHQIFVRLYSLMAPLIDLLTEAQRTNRLFKLKTGLLNVGRSLRIVRVLGAPLLRLNQLRRAT
ncbi:hypothetical protein B484DRAFT_340595, partial [Ochromonadaceae sp. CCMP2298]